MMGPWWCRLRGHQIERDRDRIGPHRKDDDLPHLRTAVGRKPATARLATSWRRLTRLASSGPRVQPTSRGEEGMTTRPSARSSAAAASATAASAAVATPAAVAATAPAVATSPAVGAIPAVGDPGRKDA